MIPTTSDITVGSKGFMPPDARTVESVALTAITAGVALTALPLALAEPFVVTQRLAVDLTGCTDVKLSAYNTTANVIASRLTVQYTLPAAPQTDFAYLIDPELALLLNTVSTSVMQVTPWRGIPQAARTMVVVRCVTISGDGVAAPTVKGVALHFR